MDTASLLHGLNDSERDRLEAVLVDLDRGWHEGALEAASSRR
jgi:hypothetical protein